MIWFDHSIMETEIFIEERSKKEKQRAKKKANSTTTLATKPRDQLQRNQQTYRSCTRKILYHRFAILILFRQPLAILFHLGFTADAVLDFLSEHEKQIGKQARQEKSSGDTGGEEEHEPVAKTDPF